MKRFGFALAVLTCSAIAMGQGQPPRPGGYGHDTPYQPAVPVTPGVVNVGGGYGGWGGGGASTAAGSAMNGMANAISAKGNYNLSTSAAAVNMTQAQKQEIQNRQQWTNTYFDMRATNTAARKAERGPAPTMEQLTRIARSGVPSPLSPSELDPVTGKLAWPGVLQSDPFAPQRDEMDQIMAKRATVGTLVYSDQEKARDTIDTMYGTLKTLIREVSPPTYTQSKNFLRSLMYITNNAQLD